MDGDKGGKQSGKRLQESLGWLAQSSVQPKKRKEIEGVSAASLVALKSQLAKKQEEIGDGSGAKNERPRGKTHPRGSVAAVLERRNAGVAERDQLDRLALKTTTDRLSESQAALERKAALYDRLASGQATDNTATEHYEVDFLMKGFTGRGVTSQRPKNVIDTAEAAVYTATGGLLSSDMAQEQERRAWEARLQEESIAEDAKDERLNIIEDLERQTREGRDRAAALRQERQSAEARKRERLKAEFLQRRLQMAKGGDNQKK